MKRILSISFSLFLMISLTANAQQEEVTVSQEEVTVSWDKTSHDFGTFQEESGKQTATFTFKNTGSENMVITNVRSSCGCTSPDWTKTPVKPGEEGYVKATYNPTNRPGKFAKSITVTTNATPSTTVLRINGNVTPE